MKISQNLNVQLSQKLLLSHQMLQSLDLIQLPLIALKEKIEQEVLENPALELVEKNKDEYQTVEKLEASFNDQNNYFEDSSSAELPNHSSKNQFESDTKRQFLEGAITRQETLQDKLLSQLHLLELSEKKNMIGETIISLIDDNGFFKEDLKKLFENDLLIAREMLEIIQTFDPPAIGSKDVREALLFQIESLPLDKIDQNAYIIVKEYFDLLIMRKDSQIAGLLKVKNEAIKKAFHFISQFEPYPGRVYDTSRIDYLIPDAIVYKKEGELIVEINEEILPSLTVNHYMNQIAQQVRNKKKVNSEKKYVSEKVQQARKFIDIIRHRHDSLFKLVLAITTFQQDFFLKGPKFLSPLTMKHVAEEIGLAESTISRLASSKYIQTEWGVHEIKYFFTNSVKSLGKVEGKSSESVREMIKEIIDAQNGKKISDQKISDILQNRGIKIARRTVAKYRKMLNILPSHQRNL